MEKRRLEQIGGEVADMVDDVEIGGGRGGAWEGSGGLIVLHDSSIIGELGWW